MARMSDEHASTGSAREPAIVVDLWTDVVCPWCYVAKTRLRTAIDGWERPSEVLLRHRAYELDPGMPRGARTTLAAFLGRQNDGDERAGARLTHEVSAMAARDGWRLDLSRVTQANSFDAHRLVALGRDLGGPALEDAMLERLFSAHFIEGLAIDGHDVLLRCAAEAGLDERRVAAVLASTTEADRVRADEEEAGRLGVTLVPHALANGRAVVSGAQPVEAYTQMLQAALGES